MMFFGCNSVDSKDTKQTLVIPPRVSYSNAIVDIDDWNDYKSWMRSEESRHYVSKELGGIKFSALLETPLYSFLKTEGLEKKSEFNDSNYSEQIRVEFELSALSGNGELAKFDISGQEDYNERINYYSFKFQDDVYLVLDSDTVPCGMAVWEREFNSAPRIKQQLLFTKPENKKSFNEIQLVFYDRVFDNGIVKLKF